MTLPNYGLISLRFEIWILTFITSLAKEKKSRKHLVQTKCNLSKSFVSEFKLKRTNCSSRQPKYQTYFFSIPMTAIAFPPNSLKHSYAHTSAVNINRNKKKPQNLETLKVHFYFTFRANKNVSENILPKIRGSQLTEKQQRVTIKCPIQVALDWNLQDGSEARIHAKSPDNKDLPHLEICVRELLTLLWVFRHVGANIVWS